ncbi:MAG: glycosyltransferase [Lachnospiraceae bacterium]|nr:glycosyltransferase [Lachnospiraceae bacterium]
MRYSVICVCRMAGDSLLRTVSSVMEQDTDDLEMIIKSDGTDEEVIGKLPKDPRLCVVSEEDNGIYDAMNRAVSMAEGDYILFLGAGDTLYDRSVLSDVLRSGRDTDIIYGDVFEETSGHKVCPAREITPFVCFRNIPCHQSCLYRRELLEDHPFETGYRVRADYEQFLGLVLKEGATTGYIPRIIASYEGNGWSESPEGRKLSLKEHRKITEKYFSRGQLFLYRAYMVLTLSSLRGRLEQSPVTSALYNRIRNALRGG